MKTVSVTIPVVVPARPEYSNIQKDYDKGQEIMNTYLVNGWTIKTVSSATSQDAIYNTYILEKVDEVCN